MARRIATATTALIAGPYRPPSLKRGDRTTCLYRDTEVVITSWTDARIPWPRCQKPRQGGGSGLLVNEELLRAIRTESAEALKYWFGVGTKAVWNWRRAFGVTQWGTEGSKRLHQATSEAGAAAVRGKPQSVDVVEQRRRIAIARDYGRRLIPGYHGRWWTKAERKLLGTAVDEDVARRVGRSASAVRAMRCRLGIPPIRDRRRREHRKDHVQDSRSKIPSSISFSRPAPSQSKRRHPSGLVE